jgi:hypothetical protein
MRLAIRGKYLSLKSDFITTLCIAFIFFLSDLNLNAQVYKQEFNGTPLSDALIIVAKQLDIRVAFDAERLGSVKITGIISGNTKDEFISDLLKNSGFGFKYRYNRYLIIKNYDENIRIPDYCQIIGSVSDRETGEHLPFASVAVFEQNILASASESGSFALKNISANPVRLMASYIGYYPLDTVISWGEPLMNLNLCLKRKLHILDTITVKGEKMEMIGLRNDVDFATTIDPVRLNDLPVLAESDIFRILQLLPGINYVENSSGLSIRGGSSDQNLVLFDGQTLYNLSHYYGVVSALNPNIIKDLQVYKGGYDSRFGERVSGIVDITGKSGNQLKPRIYGDINLLSGNITAELPVGKKVTFIGAARRSYSDIYATDFSNGLFERNLNWFGRDSVNIVNLTKPKFYFYDYNAKLTFRPSNVESFAISYYGGKDSYRNSYTGTSRMLKIDGTDNNTWSNYGLSAHWLRQWNESFFTGLQAGTSGYSNKSANLTVIDRTQVPVNDEPNLPDTINPFNTFNQNDLSDIYLSLRNTYQITNNKQLNFGLLTRRNSIYYHKDAERIYIYDNTHQTGWTTSGYFQAKITTDDNITLKPGLRATFYDGTHKLYIEPRFALNYQYSAGFSVRLAAGRYYQFINQVLAQQETGYNKNFWVMANDSIHPAVSSNHFVFGMTAEKGRFLIDAEIYYKSYFGLQEYVFVSPFLKNSEFPHMFPKKEEFPEPDPTQPSYFVTGTGKSYGLDLMLKYKSKRYTSWISYSYGRSLQQYKNINYGYEIPSPADQPHQFSWTNMYSAGKWNFGSVMQLSSGKSYIDNTKVGTSLPLMRIYKRLPNYFRTDLSANYNFTIKEARFKVGTTLINIFNTENYFDINTRKFDFENTSFSETTLIQSQAFSINVFLHFDF